ncbi:uncharacterized protein STEHIDRAFT_101265 [Stereum hirsutum FP-91666 SS1]|uniref:uncharacterized protein n=1 Tax=Stereum hirsutum (strain FP-91666) TaxID=721885 RepID=UPI0004449B71|nr:uncharacterized protein STEHIDRAFT_101265 [Stereum hirsutum FP-91666 SS1]EIM83168.1 hypothetical protein STEHIDRAFT_101265 [Stereum hirsutum FP-91666 SS1]
MSEATPTESQSEIQINVKGPSELKLQISITRDKTVRELKQAIADKSDVEADRQRLIYSGRVLKDDDALSIYKIQSSHTIHMVKGAARSANPSSSTSSTATPQQLPTMQAGQNVHDPLTQLNSHLGYGAMAGLNPFADMGVNPNDPNMLQGMMNSPEFLQQMSAVMSNPAILDQIIASNPQLGAMGPQAREMLQSERFRQMMSNPETLRSMLQMSTMLREAGLGPAGMGGMGGGMFGGGAGSFPAPGDPNAPPASSTPATGTAGATPTSPGGAGLGGAGGMFGGMDPNALMSLLTLSGGAPGVAGPGAGGAGAGFNPFMGTGGGWGAPGGGAFGGAGGFGAGGAGSPTTPSDTRPPEERFQVQLQQLQDMGFSNAAQNVRALLATGGNVHSAIEYILGGGGL